MTPERAREIWATLVDPKFLIMNAEHAILTACAEERRAAYNDALALLMRCEQSAAALALSLHMTKHGIAIDDQPEQKT